MKYQTVTDVFKDFDIVDKKGFDYYHIQCNLAQLPIPVSESTDCKYERIAMALVPNAHDDAWGTYYGSQIKGQDKAGNAVEYPPLQSITLEAVDYWYKRSKVVVNPMLKARYAGLVWDFLYKVTGQTNPPDLYTSYVKALLDVVVGEYPSHPVITVDVCSRLFSLTKGNKDYMPEVKRALSKFDLKYSVADYDKSPRLWSMYLNLMTENLKTFEEQEIADVVQRHMDRLKRLQNNVNTEKALFGTFKKQCILLAEYYQKTKQNTELLCILHVIKDTFDVASKDMTGMQRNGNLEQISSIYAHFKLSKERKRRLVKEEKSGKEALKEMIPTEFEYSYPQEALQQLRDYILQGTEQEQIQKFCMYFVPNKEEQQNQLKELANTSPVQYLLSTRKLDEKGRPMSVINGIDKDLDGQLVLHITKTIQFQSLPLNYAIRALQDNDTLTLDSIMQRVVTSSIVPAKRRDILETALRFYFKGDNLVFCHIIVPQIEAMIRELLGLCGRETICPQKNDKPGYKLRVLDDMLRDEAIEQVFNEDIANYFRIVLTDQRGLNVRNSLCHGSFSPAYFDQMVADLLLHILFLMLIRSSENKV